MDKIKNIIFDFGGVLLNIDYNKTADAFKQLGFGNFDEMYGQFKANSLFEDLETGKLGDEEFLEKIVALSSKPLTHGEVKFAWNAMLLDYRMESLEFLEKLASKYKLYLLSNTNSIHLSAFSGTFRKQTGKPSLDGYFTKAYYSHQVGLRKPNADIFEFVLRQEGLKAAETLFIDDSVNNIQTAEKLGIKTHLLLPGERIEQLGYFEF